VERVPFLLHPPSGLVVVYFLDDSHSDYRVVLIYISFMAKNTEHFFMNLLAIGTSFENYLANSFAHLLIGLFYSFGA
jgi:hypothetical protein